MSLPAPLIPLVPVVQSFRSVSSVGIHLAKTSMYSAECMYILGGTSSVHLVLVRVYFLQYGNGGVFWVYGL